MIYDWLVETLYLSAVANVLIFTGMPVLGSVVAVAACRLDNYQASRTFLTMLAPCQYGEPPKYSKSCLSA